MAMWKFCQFFLLCTSLFFLPIANAQDSLGQTIQVDTRFSAIVGKPTWTLIVREVETGKVLPYIFDIKKTDNFWIAFTAGRSYRITASYLKFGPYAQIKNFCHLENGIISGESIQVILRGALTPSPTDFSCHVSKYKDTPYQMEYP